MKSKEREEHPFTDQKEDNFLTTTSLQDDSSTETVIRLHESNISLDDTKKLNMHLRWYVLLLTCILRVGPYFCMDQINVQQQETILMMGITTTQFSWLNSFASLLAIFVAPVCGSLMDKVGVEVGLQTGVALILVSQLLASFSISCGNYWLMVLSKLVFGLGFEPMNMAKNIILAGWFFGGELSFANNISLALSRWVSFMNGVVTPRITTEFGITEAFIFGSFLCLISAFSAQVLKVIQRQLVEHKVNQSVSQESSLVWDRLLLLEILFCFFMYCATLPMNNFTSHMLQAKFGLTSVQAGDAYGYIYLISGPTLILVGLFNDSYGCISLTQIAASLVAVLGNLWWAWYPIELCQPTGICSFWAVFPPICLMGLAYGLMAGTVWNGIIYLVKGQNVGTAIGVASAALNFGLMGSPLIMGQLKDRYPLLDGGYYWVTRYSAFMAFLGLVTAIWILKTDLGRVLSDSVEIRNQRNR